MTRAAARYSPETKNTAKSEAKLSDKTKDEGFVLGKRRTVIGTVTRINQSYASQVAVRRRAVSSYNSRDSSYFQSQPPDSAPRWSEDSLPNPLLWQVLS